MPEIDVTPAIRAQIKPPRITPMWWTPAHDEVGGALGFLVVLACLFAAFAAWGA